MHLIRRLQLYVLAIALPLADSYSSLRCLSHWLTMGYWHAAFASALLWLLGSLANAAAARSQLINAAPGLDLAAASASNEDEGSRRLEQQQHALQQRPQAVPVGVFIVELPMKIVYALGFLGLATPLQALHDAWKGVETINLLEIRLRSALLLSTPQLYLKAIVLFAANPTLALLTQPGLASSALLSLAASAVAITAVWTSPAVSPERRVLRHVLRRPVVVLGCASYAAIDLALRCIAVCVAVRVMGMVALLLLPVCFAAIYAFGRAANGSRQAPHLGFATTAAFQLLGPHATSLSCPAFLTADACVTTALCALITMSSLLPVEGLSGAAGLTSGLSTRMPALPTSIWGVSASATYDEGLRLHYEAFALGMISATLCLASCKLGLFTLCVWPSRVGNAPVGVSVNPHAIERHDGSTALHHASACGSAWFCWHYVDECSASIDCADHHGRTALMLAGMGGHLRVMRYLLHRQASVELIDVYGWSPLLCTASRGQDTLVGELLAHGAALERRANDRATALHLACAHGHEATASLLIDRGSSVDSEDAEGGTALLNACANGHERVAKMLLARGAALEHVDDSGRSALLWACANGHTAVARLLLERRASTERFNEEGHTALLRAAANGHMQTVHVLLEHRANLEHMSKSGASAFLHACHHGHQSVARLLLDHGALLEHQTVQKWTALLLASSNGHTATAQMLLKRGAAIEHIDEQGCSALLHAVDTDYSGTAHMLIEHGANVERADAEGRTALQWACMRGHVNTAQVLLDAGADVDRISIDGRTGLMWACASDHEPVVRLLLDKKATTRRMDCEGDTALSLAERRGFESIAELLRTHGTEWWRARRLVILLSRELMILRAFTPPWKRGAPHSVTAEDKSLDA